MISRVGLNFSSSIKNGSSTTSKKKRVPLGYWKDIRNQRQFFKDLEPQLNIKRPEDWKSIPLCNGDCVGDFYIARYVADRITELTYNDITIQEFSKHGSGSGLSILNYYGGSLVRAVTCIYPDLLKRTRTFLDNLAKDLNIKTQSDWYNIPDKHIVDRGGSEILEFYGSLTKALSLAYPHCKWKSGRHPAGYWADIANQRKFFDQAAKQLGVIELADWNNVSVEDFKKVGGASLLNNHYNDSLMQALSVIYPDITWNTKKVPSNYWKDIQNQRLFFDNLAHRLHIEQPDDWHKVTVHQVVTQGGSFLRTYYGGSLVKALTKVYPDRQWKSWRFFKHHRLAAFTQAPKLPQKYLESLTDDHFGSKKNFIYSATNKHLTLQNNRALTHLMDTYYNSVDIRRTSSKWQLHLFEILKQFFPDTTLQLNYLHPDLEFPLSRKKAELDVFVPSLSIAFEYQGAQHYKHTVIVALAEQQKRDQLKQAGCKALGVSLIEVPYWWNGSAATLQATIHQARPDLLPLPVQAEPIPLHNAKTDLGTNIYSASQSSTWKATEYT